MDAFASPHTSILNFPLTLSLQISKIISSPIIFSLFFPIIQCYRILNKTNLIHFLDVDYKSFSHFISTKGQTFLSFYWRANALYISLISSLLSSHKQITSLDLSYSLHSSAFFYFPSRLSKFTILGKPSSELSKTMQWRKGTCVWNIWSITLLDWVLKMDSARHECLLKFCWKCQKVVTSL